MAAPPIPITSGMSWLSRAVVVNHDTDAETEVGVVSASVTIDRKSDARRVVSCELTPDVDPALLTAPHRLKLYAGYRVAGVDHWASLAHVRMGQLSRTPLGTWGLSGCMSFESLVAADAFLEPRPLDALTSMVAAIQRFILEAVPWAVIEVTTGRDYLTPPYGGVTFESDRWAAIAGRESSLATAAGVDVGCDGDGTFVIREKPTGDPMWDVSELLVDWDEGFSAEDVRNVWVVSSDHPDVKPPVRAVVSDVDPYSPTNTNRWGRAVGSLKSALVSTPTQAAVMAADRLQSTRGLSVSLSMSAVPNPWADITDIVGATRDGVTSQHQLDKITHSLQPDQPMSLQAAARTVNIGG